MEEKTNKKPVTAQEQYEYAECLYFGFGMEENKEEAFVWYEKSANQGYAPAMFLVGNACFFGSGVEKDLKKAFAWYEKAAEAGMSVAQFRLGELYEDGQGVAADREKAVFWLRKAAKAGEQLATEHLQAMGEALEEKDPVKKKSVSM